MRKSTYLPLFDALPPPVVDADPAENLSERNLIALALALGARDVQGWSRAEEKLVSGIPPVKGATVSDVRARILEGEDPLGDIFCSIRSAPERRTKGATFTPRGIARAMVDWAEAFAIPERVVDTGVGSGRFLIETGRRFPTASLLGVEVDPLPALIARANIAVSGFSDRAHVILGDYRGEPIPAIRGRTLYIGNPPYVRHHLLEPRWKRWLNSSTQQGK